MRAAGRQLDTIVLKPARLPAGRARLGDQAPRDRIPCEDDRDPRGCAFRRNAAGVSIAATKSTLRSTTGSLAACHAGLIAISAHMPVSQFAPGYPAAGSQHSRHRLLARRRRRPAAPPPRIRAGRFSIRRRRVCQHRGLEDGLILRGRSSSNLVDNDRPPPTFELHLPAALMGRRPCHDFGRITFPAWTSTAELSRALIRPSCRSRWRR